MIEQLGPLLCLAVLFGIVGVAGIWIVRPQWIERLAGAKRPAGKGRKR